MSESAEQRSKRKFIEHLDSYPWQFQVSIFYSTYQNSLFIEEHKKALNIWLRRWCKEPILLRLRTRNTKVCYLFDVPKTNQKTVPMPYIQLFFINEHQWADIERKLEKIAGENIHLKNRRLSPKKLCSYKRAVKKQKPNNLKKILGDKKINRFSLLNAQLDYN